MAVESVDVVVIGAGWHGLVAAKTYLELNPGTQLVILESSATIGGVWAKHRIYPGLRSNNLLGTYEYSDFPMMPGEFGVRPGEHIPGNAVHAYLRSYAEQFGLYPRIRFNSRVEVAERTDEGDGDGWLLGIAEGAADTVTTATTKLKTEKLIVATGLASEPQMPELAGSGSFGAALFHSSELPQHVDKLTADTGKGAGTGKGKDRVVVVYGGAKSAWDSVYAMASAGVHVDWVIRSSGQGPVWMAPPYVTPLKRWLEKLVSTRFLTWFSPCVWGDADGFPRMRQFLHGTKLGRGIVDAFWGTLEGDVVALNGYDQHPETSKLRPWYSPFWIASGLSIFNYPTDFFTLIRSGIVKIHIADITKLSHHTVHLSSGITLPADTLICCTGWKTRPPICFLPSELEQELGLSHHGLSTKQAKALVNRADAEILTRFPRLQDQPALNPRDGPNTPFRLYRFMAPPALAAEGVRNIVFCGMESTICTTLCAQAQALWAAAFLMGRLSAPSLLHIGASMTAEQRAEIEWRTVLHSRFGRWRYPAGGGERFADFVFDAIPYVDLLLKDLGLDTHRKPWWKDWWQPYGVEDYRGLVQEWEAKEKTRVKAG